ncbi:class I SAM-dependent methyltransferase [Prescottella agglutinans]|uniref:2-polyprenyl-3-methyl-5-hydroxy-6-metoxy-1, 4-benzoquinol methylase n=1 Tax=Prescottella agglutinans TaxID=1644129 RepID=A0ABT6M833_9NOCA|nr:class I SAM-dependent methyltransferase [Prescottella agglutinans]MDH6280467.1 2-polyprenyl-3-methyl-5-hydroxy-6-metoxy-1,4-benzoquinol methylase [Prescottella agglutinans]
MDAQDWDSRYSQTDMVWGTPPNPVVVEFATSLPPGRALDLACGEGRHALWLATRGWRTTGVDFSSVAIEKARRVATQAPRSVRDRLDYVVDDVTAPDALTDPSGYDLVLMIFVHLERTQRRELVSRIIDSLKPEGILMILGHDTVNLTEGIGGPPDPEILYTPEDLKDDLNGRLDVTVAERRYRDVEGGTAIDALMVARRPALGS